MALRTMLRVARLLPPGPDNINQTCLLRGVTAALRTRTKAARSLEAERHVVNVQMATRGD